MVATITRVVRQRVVKILGIYLPHILGISAGKGEGNPTNQMLTA